TGFWALTSEIDYVAAAPYAMLMILISLPLTVGREQSCSKVAVKKYSSFGASLAGGIYGGKYGAMAGAGVCVALGVATGAE
ncbi:hypothetical protein ABKW02_24125, partial [Enterobacter cloacae]